MKSNNPDLLIIDEDDATCTVLEAFFKLKGYSSLCVSTGTKALEMLKEITPKVILLDILLPDIKGYEICKRIKSNDKLVDPYFTLQLYQNLTFQNISLIQKLMDIF
ncbi:MAG: response regulator [Promethearchaeota archaeon]